MSYPDDVIRLGHALFQLQDAPPERTQISDPGTVLAARDTVLSHVRALYIAVAGSHTCQSAADDPAGPLLVALQQGDATNRHTALAPSHLAEGTPEDTSVVQRWRAAARAAITLERHVDAARNLPGPAAWTVVRDLAEIAAVLPVLDADIAAALPPDHPLTPAAVAVLTGPSSPEATARAAADLLWRTSGNVEPRPQLTTTAAPITVAPIRSLADLPAGTTTLAVLLRHRGSAVAEADIAAAAVVLADGLSIAGRVLRDAADGDPLMTAAADALTDAAPTVRQMFSTRTATPLTTRSPVIGELAGSVRSQLTAVDALADRLAGRPDDRRRLAASLLAWAETAPALANAIHGSLRAAAASDALYAPLDNYDTDAVGVRRAPKHLWQPLPAAVAAGHEPGPVHDAAAAAAATTGALTKVHLCLPAGRDAAAPPPVSLNPLGQFRATQDARVEPPPLPEHPDPAQRAPGQTAAISCGGTVSHRGPAVVPPPAGRWEQLCAALAPNVLDGPHWPALAAALDRADQAGNDAVTAFRQVVAAQTDAYQHPGIDLRNRLVELCPEAANEPTGRRAATNTPATGRWAGVIRDAAGTEVVDDASWPSLAAALERAAAAGWDVPANVPRLVAQGELPNRFPARELQFRLMADCPDAMPTLTASAPSAAASARPTARERAEMSLTRGPAHPPTAVGR